MGWSNAKFSKLTSQELWGRQWGELSPEIVNGIEEKGKKFLKHFMLNETLLWVLTLLHPWVNKKEFFPTMSIQYHLDKWWE